MKSLLLVTALCTVSVFGRYSHAKMDKSMIALEQNDVDAKFVFEAAAFKGLIDGYYRGMYRNSNYTVKDKCLDTDFLDGMQSINDVSLKY